MKKAVEAKDEKLVAEAKKKLQNVINAKKALLGEPVDTTGKSCKCKEKKNPCTEFCVT